MSSIEVREVTGEELDAEEAWERVTSEIEVEGVDATRSDEDEWRWQVGVAAMEFANEEPLESEIRRAILDALSAVLGVTGVEEEDREVWIISGNPSGEALVRAVAPAVDRFADQI